MHPEKQYLNLIKHIINYGTLTKSRNGNTINTIGTMSKYSLKNNTIPILTTKKVAWKTCLKELLWFINGDTSNKTLKKQNVKIWNGNSTREFLDSRGLTNYDKDELGPIYGYQWRNWNTPYLGKNINHRNKGIDQLQDIITNLKDPTNRYSRRLIMSAWNVEQLNQMALPPCHVLCQFNVLDKNKLYCTLYQRSADVGLGLPFNIASYSFLTHILAHHCGLKASELIHFVGNAHIYEEHIEPLKKQLENEPELFPILRIKEKREYIDDYQVEDFVISGYVSHKKINMKMRA